MDEARLRRERVRLGLTQAAVAEAVGVSQQTVARWETGQTPPSRYLRDLGALLQLPIADLLERSAGEHASEARGLELSQASAVPFGTVRLDFTPVLDEEWLSAEERAAATEWTPYEYPIGLEMHARLPEQLERRDPRLSWLWFATLDNRVVLANLHLLEAVALISNSIEDMPSYRPAPVYAAISSPEMQLLLDPEGDVQRDPANPARFPDGLVVACRAYVEAVGGLESALRRQNEIVIGTARGYHDRLPLDSDQITTHGILSLLRAINDLASPSTDAAPISDWLLNLNADGSARATYYRLGALRLIEAPAVALMLTA